MKYNVMLRLFDTVFYYGCVCVRATEHISQVSMITFFYFLIRSLFEYCTFVDRTDIFTFSMMQNNTIWIQYTGV